MSGSIKTYRKIENAVNEPQDLVRAVQVTEKNLVTVLNWAGKYAQAEVKMDVDGKNDTHNQRVKVRTPKGWRVARVGDWVIRRTASEAEIKKGAEFYVIEVGKDDFLEKHVKTSYQLEYFKRG